MSEVDMVSEYKIPIIPNLNIEKNDEDYYELNINVGRIISKKTEQISEIYNLKIDIYDDINICFEISDWDYCNLFMDEVSSENGKKKFITTNEIKFFDIECISEKYAVTLLNFHSKQSSSDSTKVNMMISGVCQECILIKDNNSINDDENVGVWNLLECSNTSHVGFVEFESNNLRNVFLKSINTHDYYSEYETTKDLEIMHNLQKKQKFSFNQLLGEDSYLYYEDLYAEISNEIIGNIDKLLMFYDSNIVPSRFVIFESIDTKKLEIRIKSKHNYKLNGSSIFKDWPNNLFNFINSTYDSYIDVKGSDIDIDLLLHYYVWIKNEQYIEVKLMLCSEFIEVLKNNKFKPFKNEEGTFYEKVFQRFNSLELDTSKLLKILQPGIFQLINALENKYVKQGYWISDVNKIGKRYKKEYLLRCIERYRNKIVHSGKFELTSDDINDIIDKLMKDFNSHYKIDYQFDLVEKIGNDLKLNLNDVDFVFDIFKQSELFERVVEIVLLKLLDVDCLLANNHNFESSKLNINDFNSKEYINEFIKK